jgi:hypothetical protein
LNEFQTRPNEQADEKVGPNEFQTQPNEQADGKVGQMISDSTEGADERKLAE